MAQAYYRKWRPKNWEEVHGQDHVVITLKSAIRQERIGHAYLFTGPRGTGKTTTARLLAKAVNCLQTDPAQRPCNECENCREINTGSFLDLIEIDAASNTSVDDVRALREKINFSPSKGKYKVYIIDEVHMLSNAAFNAILKTLEEPPPHAIFILATTEPHKIPATVISRCQRYDFRRIPLNYIVSQLQLIAQEEKIQVEPEALTLIARQATGSMRDAISLLDQLASGGEAINLNSAQQVLGAATSEHVIHLVQALASKKAADGLTAIHNALDSGSDPRQFARQVVDFLRGMLLTRLGNAAQLEVTAEMKKQYSDLAQTFTSPTLVRAVNLFNRAAYLSQAAWQPALQLELAFTEALEDPQPEGQGGAHSSLPVQPEGKRPLVPAQTQKQTYMPAASLVQPPKAAPAAQGQKQNPAVAVSPKPTSPAVVMSAGSQAEPELKKILSQWLNIKAAVKTASPETAALLNSTKLVSMQNQKLVLGFASPLLKTKMENNSHIDLTRQKIKEICEVDLPLVCTVVNINDKTITTDMNIDREGLLGTALAMGGKIVKEDKDEEKDDDKPAESRAKKE